MIVEDIQARLFACRDLTYRDFQAKLMPTVAIESIIGVRTPMIRKLAKEFVKADDIALFLQQLPHRYYDENNLHGFIISEFRDYEQAVRAVDAFLPYVDNWATCDLLSPKAFKKNRKLLLQDIDRWLASDRTYTVRFAIEMSMTHFLDEDFHEEYAQKIAAVRSEEYYVNMMIAWYFATALAKQWDSIVPFIEQRKLAKWVHNKTIQKAIESYRITEEQKAFLRERKWK